MEVATIETLYLYTRPKRSGDPILFAELITAMGRALSDSRCSTERARIGANFIYNLEEQCILELQLNQDNQYIIKIINDAWILDIMRKCVKIHHSTFPSLLPYDDWDKFYHSTSAKLIKSKAPELKKISPNTHPIVFDSINRSQSVGWNINKRILPIAEWCLKRQEAAFSDIWNQVKKEAKATKSRESKTIIQIAKEFINSTFYHLYYLDFRGRCYPTTAYLHEQGSDLAKGLLLRADKKRIGEGGYRWLCISIASNWAGASGRPDGAKTDKIPMLERYQWTQANLDVLLSYARDPQKNKGWMDADKCWQFLAACIELKKIHDTVLYHGANIYDYESHLECFIDGSTNGSQHLAALTRDEVTAPYVNLVPSRLPGDLYTYVANSIWKFVSVTLADLDPNLVAAAEVFVDTIIEMKAQVRNTEPRSELRKAHSEKLQYYRNQYHYLEETAAFVFWNRVKDLKERRKIVKRGVMTLPYGGTSYGLGEQVLEDSKKHGIDLLKDLDMKWGTFMGRLIFMNCKDSLKNPMKLLDIFSKAGVKAEKRDEYLSWTVPVTKFPVIQHYDEGTIKKVLIMYGGRELKISIYHSEFPTKAKRKQGQGAAPNIVHSLDAAHLMLTKVTCPFTVTTIHDSYGCLLADMDDLFRIVRETFVDLYRVNPLDYLMEEIQGDMSGLEIGALDINSVLKSEYCFS
jgi:DNA-directed RNA polymerase